MRSVSLPVLSLLLCAFGVATAQQSTYGTAATVNGVEISNAVLEQNFTEYQRENNVNIASIRYPKRINLMRRQVLDQLIDQEIVWQTAQARGLVADEQEVAEAMEQVRAQFASEEAYLYRLKTEGFTADTYRKHITQLLSSRKYLDAIRDTVVVSEAERHQFYVSNPDKFKMPEVVRARHILLKIDPRAIDMDRQLVQNKARRLLQQIEDGADFATLAREQSEDSSAAQGGDLGYFPRGKMVAPFEDAAFALQPGETSPIIESQFGLHIIRVEDHQDAQTVPEDKAIERIEGFLLQTKHQQAIDKEIAALRESATVDIAAAL